MKVDTLNKSLGKTTIDMYFYVNCSFSLVSEINSQAHLSHLSYMHLIFLIRIMVDTDHICSRN